MSSFLYPTGKPGVGDTTRYGSISPGKYVSHHANSIRETNAAGLRITLFKGYPYFIIRFY